MAKWVVVFMPSSYSNGGIIGFFDEYNDAVEEIKNHDNPQRCAIYQYFGKAEIQIVS